MTQRFIVRPEAEADLASAFRWYEAKSWGLGTEFLRAVDVCFAKVRRTPQAYRGDLITVELPQKPLDDCGVAQVPGMERRALPGQIPHERRER
jgi:hypothetical protein